jgi:uncharacterized membrane protein
MKSTILPLLLALALLALVSCAPSGSGEPPAVQDWEAAADGQIILRARVIDIVSESEDVDFEESGQNIRTTVFTARITAGPMSGSVVTCRLVAYAYIDYNVKSPKAGNAIYLHPTWDENGQPLGELADYNRTGGLAALFVLFVAVLCLIGGKTGARSLVALVFTAVGLLFVFLPMVKAGASPVFSALLVCSLVTIITLVIIGGLSAKTFAALLGIIAGLVVSGILTAIMQSVMKMTGAIDSESVRLSQMPAMEHISLNGLMFAAILIGALGAAMDVGVSIASALEELNRKSGIQGAELVESGMRIGRDVMGTMTNTLVLAYVGGSLHLIMLISMDTSQLGYLFSWELIATEFLRALAGSIGLICIVPATALISAIFCRAKAPPENPFA